MSVDNAADLRERFVQFQVGGGIRRRIQVTFNLVSIHIDDNHVRRLQFLIGNSARFDHKQTLFTVNSADIAPCKCNKAILRKLQVRFADILFQFLKHIQSSKKPY